ncbi:MAG: hypothetical protein ACEPOV_05630 [Hyphomicrobiales bacterium]
MKLKLRYKSLVSSLKKAILKLKGKAVLCTKQSKPTNLTLNILTDKPTRDNEIDLTLSSSSIDIFFLIFGERTLMKRNVITKRAYSTGVINRIIKSAVAVFSFQALLRHNTLKYLIYHRKSLITELQIQTKKVRRGLVNKGESFFCFKQI